MVDIGRLCLLTVINMLRLYSQRDGEILCVCVRVVVTGRAAEGTAVKGVARVMMSVHHCVYVCVCVWFDYKSASHVCL